MKKEKNTKLLNYQPSVVIHSLLSNVYLAG